jgi:hypothetical protein
MPQGRRYATLLIKSITYNVYLALLLSSVPCAAIASCLDGSSLGVAITRDEIAGCEDMKCKVIAMNLTKQESKYTILLSLKGNHLQNINQQIIFNLF